MKKVSNNNLIHLTGHLPELTFRTREGTAFFIFIITNSFYSFYPFYSFITNYNSIIFSYSFIYNLYAFTTFVRIKKDPQPISESEAS